MLKVKMPPVSRGRIKAVRSLIGALTSATKAARKARDKAEAKYGPFSDDYAAEKARYDEASDLLKRLYCLLNHRLEELERPFR